MKKLAVLPISLGCVFVVATSQAIDLKQSKLTQVVNDVQIISAADQKQKNAAINDIFAMPDILRTGAASRAELVAEDQTVTRVGANTIFSFDPANRTIDLKQGSLLFHAPHGKGGGTIHTGSATASVLGTTLIIVSTANGGFKVIALEGRVEVKFLNGLKQKLDPGQMTFVLPGANQLAPVVIFRLDELTQNSLLVKGFQSPLDSLPLIQHQINQQEKLISSGGLGKTDLVVGDGASGSQVEVLDINTIQHGQQDHNNQPQPPVVPPTPPPPTPNLKAAENADATINVSSLTDASIPTPPDHVYLSQFSLDNIPFFNGRTFAGFVARNIFINTLGSEPGIKPAVVPNIPTPSSLAIDLSEYAGLSTFDMVAVNNLNIEGSVSFKGLPTVNNLELIAGGQFVISPGVTVDANVNTFSWRSPAAISLDNDTVENLNKDLAFNSASGISIMDNSTVMAAGKVTAMSGNNITLDSSLLGGTSAFLTSLGGSITLDNSTIDTSAFTILFAPISISILDNTVISSDFVTLNATGPSTITIDNSVIDGKSSIVANSVNDINITGGAPSEESHSSHPHFPVPAISALNVNPNSGSITLSTVSGSINIDHTTIATHFLTLNSGDGILLDGAGNLNTFVTSVNGATANLTARGTVALNNADFSPFATVNIAANTINLYNVHFNGLVNLKSALGYWYNGFKPGAVNDLGFVYYDGLLVDVPNFTTGQLPNTGITVGALNPTPLVNLTRLGHPPGL